MNGPTRRTIQMGDRVDQWNDLHPDDDAGNASSEARIKSLVAQAHALLAQQREGFVSQHAGTERKRQLRRQMSAPIAHMAEVGRVGATENPDLSSLFRFKPSTSSHLAYQTAAHAMVAAGQEHRELLIKHGLAAPMLDSLGQMAEQFDAAVAQTNNGRAAHVAATRQLKKVAAEISRTVRVMNGRNRQRFQNDGLVLGAWISASTVLGTPRGTSEEPSESGPAALPPSGDVRPAA
jgi:hypothetical protein